MGLGKAGPGNTELGVSWGPSKSLRVECPRSVVRMWQLHWIEASMHWIEASMHWIEASMVREVFQVRTHGSAPTPEDPSVSVRVNHSQRSS